MDLPLVLAAIIFILIVAAINMRGIAESVKVNLILTSIEIAGLIDRGDRGGGPRRGLRRLLAQTSRFEGGSVMQRSSRHGALLLLDDRLRGLGERRRGDQTPARNFPRALFTGLAVAGVLYLLVTLTASYVVPTGQLSGSDAPLLEVVEVGPLGISTKLFAFIALMAVANSALINMIMASRIVYGMADQGIVARLFARTLPARRTPVVAIIFTTVIAMILISTGDLSTLADTTVVLLLSVFTIVNVAVLVLRRDPVDHEHFHAPSVFPVLGDGGRLPGGGHVGRRSRSVAASGHPGGGGSGALGGQPCSGRPSRGRRSRGPARLRPRPRPARWGWRAAAASF